MLMLDDQILLQKRKGSDELNGFYAPISGKVDVNESPVDAVIREAFEEAGLIIDPKNLSTPFVTHWSRKPHCNEFIDVIEFYFSVYRWKGNPSVRETDKVISIDFYPTKHLPYNTVGSVALVLKAMEEGQSYVQWKGAEMLLG